MYEENGVKVTVIDSFQKQIVIRERTEKTDIYF
jgi:hypothetical protein